jgi:hypothetical protein
MANDARNNGGPLLVDPAGDPANDQRQQPLLTTPAPEPAPPAGTTISLTLPPLTPEHGEMAQQALAAAVNAIGGLLPAATPAPPPKAKGSDLSAQALVAGLLKGLGAKYQDRALTKAGGLLEQRMGLRPAVATKFAVAAKPGKSTRKPRVRKGGKRGR